MKTEKKAPMTLLVQIEPFGEFNVKARGEVMIKAMDEGYNWIDASGSRLVCEE